MPDELSEFISVVEAWRDRRQSLAQPFSQDGLRRFIETHNGLTRRMISLLRTNEPEFYSALLELTQNASTMVQGGKIFANKVDRTNT